MMPDRARTMKAIPLSVAAGFAVLLAMVVGSFMLSQNVLSNARLIGAGLRYQQDLTLLLDGLRDAEAGQRGFLLTRKPLYLDQYRTGVARAAPVVDRLDKNDVRRAQFAVAVRPLVEEKLAELARTIMLTQNGRTDAAIAIVQSDRGKALMDTIRLSVTRERDQMNETTVARRAFGIDAVRGLSAGLALGAVLLIVMFGIWLRDTRRKFAAADADRRSAEAMLAALQVEVSAREQAEGQLRQLQKMESLGALTGGIAHDFNNMLAVVLGGIELAKRRLRTDPDKADQLLDNAREGATRAATLTARLLAFSRNQPLAPAPLDLNKLVGGMCDMLHRTLGDTIQVECVYSAGLWRCYADPNEVENAILNLAINARDAMAERGGHLTVETANAHIDDNYARSRADVAAGQYVLVCVTDTGIGMSQDIIDRAFDPFFTTKAVGKGTGLGLSQVFGFVKQSGGHVALYSEPGQGTTVKLYLPRFSGADPAQLAPTPIDQIPEGKATEIVLVVEDEQRVRHFAVDALRELGYTAISAASPDEALQALREQPEITMLFTDIVMPDMTGRQLADAALELRPGLKILFTTGYTRNAVVHNGMLDVGVAFLPKPYGMGDLARKIRDVLDGGGINRLV
jgi:signal transduction histidine kinase/CheY-like chemotaxis protein